MKKIFFVLVAALLVWQDAHAGKGYTSDTQPPTCVDGDFWVDTNGTSTERFHICEEGTWVKHLGNGTTSNPSFLSVHASGGNLAAANAQVTKKWITGLSYTADVTSVIHGGKHWIAKTTHTAGSTTEPGVGVSYADAWTEVSGAGDALGSATYSDVVALWTTCTGYLYSDGTCSTPSGTFTYPGAGVPNSTGSAWGTSYTVGTGANNLVQLNASSQIPAVSGALLTNIPYSGLSGLPTLGTSAQYDVGTSIGNIVRLADSGGNPALPFTINFFDLNDGNAGAIDAPGTAGQVPSFGTNGALTWATKIGGSTGSTDNAVLRADGTGGSTAQSTGITVDDSNNVTVPGNISSNGSITGLMPSKVISSPSGTHDGSSNVATLSDSGESFTTNAYVGMTLYNITDGSSCTVTANDGTTMTCTLAGGTDNDWDASDAWQVGPGPYQSGSWFYVTGAGTIRHPSTAGYQVCYESDAAAVLTVDMASSSMIFQGVLDSAVTALDAGDSIDSSGSTTGDFQCIHNKSATEAQGKGKRGTWVDGGAT